MLATKGYAVKSASSAVEPFSFERRELGPHDVLITIDYCGICHTDIHQTRNEWGNGLYPMVPGHEIVGHVAKVGDKVSKFKAGDVAGVGCFVDACRVCGSCLEHQEQFCLHFRQPRERACIRVCSKISVMQAGRVGAHRCAAPRIQRGSKRQVPADAEAHRARRNSR